MAEQRVPSSDANVAMLPVLSSWRSRGKRAAAMMCGSEPMMHTPWFVGQRTVQLAAWAHTNGLPLTRARLPALLHELAIDVLDSGIRLAKTFDGHSVLGCLKSALKCNRCDDDDILPYCIGLCISRPTCKTCRLSSVFDFCVTVGDRLSVRESQSRKFFSTPRLFVQDLLFFILRKE